MQADSFPECRLIEADATNGRDAKFQEILASNQALGRGIDTALKTHNLDALVLPSRGYTTRPAGESISYQRRPVCQPA